MADELPLASRVERRIDGLAREMVASFVEQVPIYARLPREQLDGEILDISRANLRVFFRCLREDRLPGDDELAEPRASAARRAEERVPLESVLTAYHIGGRVGWRALVAEATPAERDDLETIGEAVMAYVQAVTGAVSSAYMEEQQHIYGEQRDARRNLTEALIAGRRDQGVLSSLTRRAGVRPADGYLVLALRLGASDDERDEGVAGAVAGRRKVRRVQAQLDTYAGEPVLTLLDPDGGPVLFPVGADAAEAALADADSLVEGLAAAAGAGIVAGLAWRPETRGVAAAAEEAREVLELAVRLSRPPGAYRLDDVLLEHALTHPASTADRLCRLLAPLEDRPDLIETLDHWYRSDFDRRAAASALNVHPNTLDYRLRRVTELTGFDAGTARGLQLLGAALTARRVRDPADGPL